MRIPLDRQSTVPLYQQIENHLRQGILSGSLAANTRLPASRQLARDLGVNRITVENAYAELETDGLIFTKLGSGTYVLPPDPLLTFTKNDSTASWPLWQHSIEFQGKSTGRPSDDLKKAVRHPHPISFASGKPPHSAMPVQPCIQWCMVICSFLPNLLISSRERSTGFSTRP